MSRQQPLHLQRGIVVLCTLVAIVLLATFYTVVSGAVSHAAVRRMAMSVAPSTTAVAAGKAAVGLGVRHAVLVAGAAR